MKRPVGGLVVAILAGAVIYLQFSISPALGQDIRSTMWDQECDRSAVLLTQDVDVLNSPNGELVARVNSGTPVYLCRLQGNYRRIIFPRSGTADCSSRTNNSCRSGFVLEPFGTVILG